LCVLVVVLVVQPWRNPVHRVKHSSITFSHASEYFSNSAKLCV
jgi:hypothetical protein